MSARTRNYSGETGVRLLGVVHLDREHSDRFPAELRDQNDIGDFARKTGAAYPVDVDFVGFGGVETRVAAIVTRVSPERFAAHRRDRLGLRGRRRAHANLSL